MRVRQVFLVTNTGLDVWLLEGRKPAVHVVRFEEGMQVTAEYQAFAVRAASFPVQVLVDLAEEDFRLEQVPRLHGPDRKALIERHLRRHFRETPYRGLCSRLPDAADRRKELLLLAGLIAPDQIDRWLEHGGHTADGFAEAAASTNRERVALPVRLLLRHHDNPALLDARTLLALAEQAQEMDDETEAEALRKMVRNTLKHGTDNKDEFRIETYYGLLLMDGDRMGELLAQGGGTSFRESFHPRIREQFDQRAEDNALLQRYGNTPRPPSPGRHMAISGALNDFALHVVPHIVQREYLGRLIYGGGDDVLAMLPVADLLPAAARLRDAWSGQTRFAAVDEADSQRRRLKLENGFALLDGNLLRLMGGKATASAGLVVAHHQAPLSRVLRELREAEHGAKEQGGRDAVHIRVLKRSGGALALTLKWDQLAVFQRLLAFLHEDRVSRRAVYHCLTWLRDLPEPTGEGTMLAHLLSYQFRRQTDKTTADAHHVEGLAADIVGLSLAQPAPLEWTENFLSVAEFLAREARAVEPAVPRDDKQEGEAA